MPLSENEFVPVSISLSADDAKFLKEVAERRHLSVSELVRQGLSLLYQKVVDESEAGVYTDLNNNVVFVGLLSDEAKARLARGELKKVKDF